MKVSDYSFITIGRFHSKFLLWWICCTKHWKHYKWILIIAQAVYFPLSHHPILYRMVVVKFNFSWIPQMGESTTFFLLETSFYRTFRRKHGEGRTLYRNNCRLLCKILICSNFFLSENGMLSSKNILFVWFFYY